MIEVCLTGISHQSDYCITIFLYMCTENLALHQSAWQNSTWRSYARAERAVDGRYTGLWWDRGQCAASNWGDQQQPSGGWIYEE